MSSRPHPSRTFEEAREHLKQRILAEGIERSTPERPLVSNGRVTDPRWMLDLSSVALSSEGGALIGQCLRTLLAGFEGRQLATFGLTGIPILQSILQSPGEPYNGLILRKERKGHGARKQIEGQVRKDQPVILIDDTLASGGTLERAEAILAEEGLWVEGAVVLGHFGWANGFARLQQKAWHVEALFDVMRDLAPQVDGRRVVHNPLREFPDVRRSARAAPEGLHPAILARLVLQELLTSGELLRAPTRLDGPYEAAGGAFISVRDRQETGKRYARSGFWNLPKMDPVESAAESVLLAASLTVGGMPDGTKGLEVLAKSTIAVSFYGELQPAEVGELDPRRFGVVVSSRARPGWQGGALPELPGIRNGWEQFQHARRFNGRLLRIEPSTLYRYSLTKCVEPGGEWAVSGFHQEGPTWNADAAMGKRLAQRAHGLVRSHLDGNEETGEPLPADLLPKAADYIFLSVFKQGKLSGCKGLKLDGGGNPETTLRALVPLVLGDRRFAKGDAPGPAPQADPRLSVEVTLLHGVEELGEKPREEVTRYFRLGEDALEVSQGARSAILLPATATLFSLDSGGFVAELVDKAGITRAPYRWRRWGTSSWLCDGEVVQPLFGVLPLERSLPAPHEHMATLSRLMTEYLVRNQKPDGVLYTRYLPFQDKLFAEEDIPRQAFATWTLARRARLNPTPELTAAAQRGFDHLRGLVFQDTDGITWVGSPKRACTVSEVATFLCTLTEQDWPDRTVAQSLGETLVSRIDAHGRVATERGAKGLGDQDYLPGQALMALGHADRVGLVQPDLEVITRALRYGRHRFRHGLLTRWQQLTWAVQAHAAWAHRPELTDVTSAFAFEAVDWALKNQTPEGAFLSDQQPDTPGFTTGVYLEAVASALGLAKQRGDTDRTARYARALEIGARFLDQLICQERDSGVLPNPGWAEGGLRCSLHTSWVRPDFVCHALNALTLGDPAFSQSQ